MIGRQLGIVYLLLSKQNITAAKLAERFEVSVRTIYRDVEALSMAGIPVYARKGKNGGISLTDSFVLDKMMLSKEEQETILAALNGMQQAGAADEEETLKKLGSFFQIERESWVAIDFSDWSGRRGELFEQIKRAILQQKLLRFDYYGQSNVMKSRTVEPVQLVFKEFTWYLRAFCRERNAMRMFKVMRMKRVECLEEGFLPDAGKYRETDVFAEHEKRRQADVAVGAKGRRKADAHAGEEECRRSDAPAGHEGSRQAEDSVEVVVLRVAASEAWRIYDRFEEEEVTCLEDGSFLIRMRVRVDEWVYGMILGFGPAAEVVEPPHVREQMRRRLRETLKKYQA